MGPLIAIGAISIASIAGGAVMQHYGRDKKQIAGISTEDLEAAISRARSAGIMEINNQSQRAGRQMVASQADAGLLSSGAANAALAELSGATQAQIAKLNGDLAMAEAQGLSTQQFGYEKNLLGVGGDILMGFGKLGLQSTMLGMAGGAKDASGVAVAAGGAQAAETTQKALDTSPKPAPHANPNADVPVNMFDYNGGSIPSSAFPAGVTPGNFSSDPLLNAYPEGSFGGRKVGDYPTFDNRSLLGLNMVA